LCRPHLELPTGVLEPPTWARPTWSTIVPDRNSPRHHQNGLTNDVMGVSCLAVTM
jgi:hypothetical protein